MSNPLQDLVALQDRMNRLFEDATQRRAREAAAGNEIEGADWYPPADIYENDSEFTLAVDLPGIDRSELDISVDEQRLLIRGIRSRGNAPAHRIECPRGKFLKSFSLPTTVDQQKIEAEYKDGVLQVHLPKRQEQRSQRVEIKVS